MLLCKVLLFKYICELKYIGLQCYWSTRCSQEYEIFLNFIRKSHIKAEKLFYWLWYERCKMKYGVKACRFMVLLKHRHINTVHFKILNILFLNSNTGCFS